VQPKYLMAAAMCVLTLAMWHSTALAPDASFSFFARMRVFQVVAMPFLFIPITAVAYAGLPPEKTNQASALINVARNLGGSIGVSLAGALLVQREQFHQSRLVEHLYPSSPIYSQALRNAAQHFVAQGSSAPDAQHQAIGQIGQMVQNQSALLAYMDVFFAFAIFAALMVPLTLMLKPVEGGAPAAH
jgi:DHA2 family multidrug resistance protein